VFAKSTKATHGTLKQINILTLSLGIQEAVFAFRIAS
jgi:hypothetical protein